MKELAEEKEELANKVESLEEDLTNEREKLEQVFSPKNI